MQPHSIGNTSIKMKVYDSWRTIVGTVYDARSIPIGHVGRGGTVYDARNIPVGQINLGGTVLDTRNIPIGRVGLGGTTYNAAGTELGYGDMSEAFSEVRYNNSLDRDQEGALFLLLAGGTALLLLLKNG
jgi:hypothetical protein